MIKTIGQKTFTIVVVLLLISFGWLANNWYTSSNTYQNVTLIEATHENEDDKEKIVDVDLDVDAVIRAFDQGCLIDDSGAYNETCVVQRLSEAKKANPYSDLVTETIIWYCSYLPNLISDTEVKLSSSEINSLCQIAFFNKENACRDMGIGAGGVSRACDYNLEEMLRNVADAVYSALVKDFLKVYELQIQNEDYYAPNPNLILTHLNKYYNDAYTHQFTKSECELIAFNWSYIGTAFGGIRATCSQQKLVHAIEVLMEVRNGQSESWIWVEKYGKDNFLILYSPKDRT